MRRSAPPAPSKAPRSRAPRLRAAIVLASAFGLACATAVAAVDLATWKRCLRAAPAVNVGSLPLDFVANAGQAGPGVAYEAPFAGGALTVDAAGRLSVDLAATEHLAGAAFTVDHGAAGATLASPAGHDLRYPGHDLALPAHGAVHLVVQAGIDVWLRGTSRGLEARWRLEPGADAGTPRVSWGGATGAVVSSHKVEMTLSEGADGRSPRRLRLYAPRAWQTVGGEEVDVDVAYTLEGSTVGFQVGAYDHGSTLWIETWSEHSPYGLPHATAWGPADAVHLASASAGRVVAARLDEAGGRVLDAAVLDAGTDAVAGLAVDAAGTVRVLGEAARGGTVVATFAGDAATVDDLAPLAGLVPHDVLVDEAGRVFVAGELAPGTVLEAPVLDELVTVLPADGTPVQHAVVELDAERHSVVAAQVFPAVPARLRLWKDCWKYLTVGVHATTDSCALQQLAIDEIDLSFVNGYANYPGEWGHYLLQWKQYRASYGAAGYPTPIPGPSDPVWTTVPFNPGNADTATDPPPEGPILDVGIGAAQAAILNQLEADSSVFPNGDPNGGWQHGDAFTLAELAVAAGLYIDKPGSPMAARLNIGGAHEPVVITAVEYCIEGGVYTRIQDLIPGWDPLSTWDPNGGNPIDVVDSQWAAIYGNGVINPDYFEVESLTMAHWPGSGWTALTDDDVFTGSALDSLFDPPSVGAQVATDWVADPPEEVPGASDIVRETASRLAPRVLRTLDVETTRYAAGKVVDHGVESAAVPREDLR